MCSQAIKTALAQYNAAAKSLHPPKPELKWEQVVKYTFLSEFNFLHCACHEDISSKPWATPAGRFALDQHFKEKQAHVEIQQLNVEIVRLVTSIRDEEQHFEAMEVEHKDDLVLLFHIKEYRCKCTRFDEVHLSHLSKLSCLPGFTGTLLPGKALEPYYGNLNPSFSANATETAQRAGDDDDTNNNNNNEQTDEEEEAAVGEQVVGLISVATDSTVEGFLSENSVFST